MKPMVSVIMPVFNCEGYIAQALESILNQTYQNLEILVCDDASKDRTWEILCSYNDSRINLFRNEVNRGVIPTKNFLFEKAKGDYLTGQDGDDWSVPDRIEIQLREFLSDPSLSACATNSFRVTNMGKISKFKDIENQYITLKECYQLPFMPACLMIKKEVLKIIGGLNNFFSGLLAEDLYWVALIAERYKVKYMNVPLYYYRFNENSITNTFDRKEKLVVIDLINELIEQRIKSGSDWIQEKNFDAIQNFINAKFSNRKWLSEQYRTMASVQRDGKKRNIAFKLIFRALKLNPFNVKNYMTLRYILS